MPIKKRGGGGDTFALTPTPKRDKREVQKANKLSDKLARRKKQVSEKTPSPIPKKKAPPKLTNVKRRLPMTSDYVYTDGGVLVIKTPPTATRWNNDFRVRIIRDYIAPRTLKLMAEFERSYIDSNIQKEIHTVMGKRVMVNYPHERMENTRHCVVLRTDVVNLSEGTKLFLHHEEPAMRVLMVYCFLAKKQLGGVPKLIVDDYRPE